MDRTDWFLALITFLLAVIALETVTVDTNQVFRDIGGSVSLLVIFLLPLYLLVHVVVNHHDEPDWSDGN
ncbi:hypothetical protein RBH26_14380 [Natronolimnohabitans sp. A-GB9]|uniref:hypothetical protein n=1 Tax=Natronolimnohabitans sp. A-GB9 TaxID=3069757 RepID=UPI0027AF4DFC|nr:hypothetical protein [Natronolimnohabitans sp. A-GB9]MDQ2051663.1 hypothetical protein [Natronolimnohabitans sp. A-GB9]